MPDAITTTAQLIEQGYLVPTQVFAHPTVLEHELHAGSVIEAYQSTCAGKRVIVFANTVVHAEYLAAQFNAAGILAYAVLARDNNAVRTAALESFSAGTCMVLITINVDLSPAKADGIIIATPHNSARRFEHQIVSAMRPRFAPRQDDTDAMRRAAIARSDKPVAMIIDLADNVLRHPDVIASVTHRAKPDTHLTIPGSLEWEPAPVVAAPAVERRESDLEMAARLVEGKTVSVDVSTCDADAGNRLFCKIVEVMEDGDSFTLLAVDPEPNFETSPPAPASVVLPERKPVHFFGGHPTSFVLYDDGTWDQSADTGTTWSRN